MAGGETSFYTFTYKWKVNDLETHLCNPSRLNGPVFSSPPGAEPATKWMLTIYNGDCMPQTSPVQVSKQCLSVELHLVSSTPIVNTIPRVNGGFMLASTVQSSGLLLTQKPCVETTPKEEYTWVVAKLKPESLKCGIAAKSTSQGPTKMRLPKPIPNNGLFTSSCCVVAPV